MKGIIPLNIIPPIQTEKSIEYPDVHPLYDAFNSDLSLYIHFPFCMDKCLFCPIKTYKYDASTVEAYLIALKREITYCLKKIGYRKVDNIHFGGGTPSLMKVSELESILEVIRKDADIETAEILVEAHPGFVTDELIVYLSRLKNCTINFGVQSFDKAILRSMKRYCNNIELVRNINKVKQMGIALGIDYICGWPNSCSQTIDNDMRYIAEIRPNHISQYPLRLSPHLKHSCFGDNGADCFKQKAELNRYCEQILLSYGYERYSAFHYQRGKTFTHRYGRNQINCGKWIGFGANAYTYLGNIAYINSDIPEYANNNFIFEKDVLNHCEQFAWEFLFLIRARPLYRQDIIERYGTIISKRMETILRTFFEKNILSQSKIYR